VEITAVYDFLGFYEKNVIIKDPILSGYGCVVVFNCRERPPVMCKSQVTLCDLQNCNSNCQRKLQLATRAVQNRAAGWDAAGGGISGNLLKTQACVN